MKNLTLTKQSLLSLLLVVLSFAFANKLSSQCNFNCIDTVNVSVNNLCTATITPSMLLKGFNPGSTCNYGIELFDQNNDIINLDFTRADIGPQYVGTALKVRIFEAGVTNPNSCWSIVNVEDKLPPDIVCVGNDTLDCFRRDVFADDVEAAQRLKTRIEATLIDNCGNEEVTISITKNDLTRAICQDTFAAIRVVGYNVFDNNLNVTSCEDTIFYYRFPIDSIDAPKNYVGSMAIDCQQPYPTVGYLIGIDRETAGNNSTPNIDGVSIADYSDSLFTERGLCNLKMSTTDLVFPTCGNTYKIVRRWTIIDWCSSSVARQINQVIKVVDENISVNNISNIGPHAASKGTCDLSVDLPTPTVSQNECNSWTFAITIREPDGTLFFPFGGERDSASVIESRVFALGTSIVRYTVEDACGNIGIKEFEVTIEDEEDPVAVCDFGTVVTLNDSYLGKVYAESFDDGSYDHCSGIVSYKVRRLDRLETDCPTPDDFDDFVKFCCSDIGRTIMVELQVTDGVGRTSICMAEARVQFRGAGPSVACQPDPAVQSCLTYDDFDITSLTPPTVSSSNPCIASGITPQVREVSRDIDVCGDGAIEVEWYYNITGEEEVICTNTITFSNPNPFTVSDIQWPTNRVVESCDDAPATAEELENIVNTVNSCTNVFPSEPVDRILENVPNTCIRILRTWTVVDWCRYPGDPNAKWTYEQTIDVVNSSAPVIDISDTNISLDPKPDSCRAIIVIQGVATDDCTPADDLEWTYRLDLARDGQEIPLIFERPGRILSRRIDAGNYIITWTATDGCGNTAIARQEFTIEDNLFPTAVCGVVIRDMPASNSITVTALELDGGSTDNCKDELFYAIRRAGDTNDPVESLTFTCSDIGVNQIELWVSDYMGNQSVCTATVDIRDGEGTCGFGAGIISLGGLVKTPEDIAVESAEVTLSMNSSSVGSEMTTIEGQYAFNNLQQDEQYILEASKNDDYINGISTLDIVLMQRHILGLQLLDSPYKVIAADVNNNESISAVDLVILRRLILGHISELPDVGSWRFIDKDAYFEDPIQPWPIEEEINVGRITAPTNQQMLAIKVGDLNSTAIANSGFASSRSLESFDLERKTEIDGSTVKMKLKVGEDISTLGYQLAFDYNQKTLRLKNIQSLHTAIVDEMIYNQDGQLRISVGEAYAKNYNNGDILVELTFELISKDVFSAEMLSLSNAPDFQSEIYTDDLTALTLQFNSAASIDEVVLYQNRPNPFDNETFIEFEIPKSQTVSFELYDVNGGRILSRQNNFTAGSHQISINREELGLIKGIYYYQIHTQERSLIKKMIVL